MERLTPEFAAAEAELLNSTGLCPAPYSLRVAKLDDVDGVLAMGRACFEYNAPTRDEIRHMVTNGHGIIALLCRGEQYAGYVHIEAHSGRKTFYLNTVALMPEDRGKGVGGVLYDFTTRLAEKAGARGISCHVATVNEAGKRMLEKHGYDIVGEEPEYYDDGRDAYTMRKLLKAFR